MPRPGRQVRHARRARHRRRQRRTSQFELAWDWRVSPGGNSGVKYFVLEDRDAAIGHEYQVIDDAKHPDAKIGPHRQTAALYDVLAAANRPSKPAGEWNTEPRRRGRQRGRALAERHQGARVRARQPGAPQAIAKSKFKDIERFGKPLKGYILLQDHGDAVCYRNVKVRALNGKS